MADPTGPEPAAGAPRGLVRRHLMLIATIGMLVTGGAYAYARLTSPTYTASANVLVSPYTLPNAANPAPDLGTEQAIATSTAVLVNAAHALNLPLSQVRSAASVSASVTADVLTFNYAASTAQQASHGATTTAAAYMAFRAAQAQPSPRHVDITKRLAVPAVKTRLISPAQPPTAPSSPDPVLDVIAGLIVGLLAGLAVAFVVDRFGRRLRNATRWQETTGVPVLAGLPVKDLAGPRTTSDRPSNRRAVEHSTLALRYVRVRLAQTVRPGAVLLIAAVRDLPEQNLIAGSVAEGFRDLGWTATLISLSPDDDAGLDVLLRQIEHARASHDLVVVTAPPINCSVIVLDVAARADAALVIDDLGRARRSDAVGLVAELRTTGVLVAGGVLLGVATARTGSASSAPVSPSVTAAPRIPGSPVGEPSVRRPARPRAPLVDWTDELEAARDHVNGSMP